MKRIIIVFLFALGRQILVFAQDTPSPGILRIAVVNRAASVKLSIKGPYQIRTLYTDELLDSGKSFRNRDIFPLPQGIGIGEKSYMIFGVKIKPQKKAAILLNGRRYRGEMDIIKTREIKLLLVNYVEVEEYLYGVLEHEVSHRWPLEALKAQAIASRTYALYQSLINQDKDYDLTADFYSQMYGGRTSEKYRTTKAVNLTRGKVLTYQGKLFPAYFHATCGGHTEDASQLWDVDIAPLKGVKCDFCRLSPHYRWKSFLTFKELEEKLKKNGYALGRIVSLIPRERNPSGRIRALSVVSKKGELKILAKDFRRIFDPRVIRSTNFVVEMRDNGVVFRGYGWGHGVGLCQWGAYFMALKGYKAEEILKFYYPGAEIKSH